MPYLSRDEQRCGPCRKAAAVHLALVAENRCTTERYEIKVVKVQGEFVWHSHEDTDELFLALAGESTIRLRDRDVVLQPGQLFVVRRGIEHCPVAREEVYAVLIEPMDTVNTGNAGGALTAKYEVI